MENEGSTGEQIGLTVYCPECMQDTTVDPATGKGRCRNPECPTPYRFILAGTEDKARRLHADQSSWMPKFYFQVPGTDEWAISYYDDPIQPFFPARLTDLVDLATLTLFEGTASDALGQPLTVIEPKSGIEQPCKPDDFERIDPPGLGDESTEDARQRRTRHWCKFCRKLRGWPDSGRDGDKRCQQEDFKITAAIWRGERDPEGPYQCWAGLIDYTVPVRVAGRVLAVCFSGQKRPGPNLQEVDHRRVEPLEEKVRAAARKAGENEEELLALAQDETDESLQIVSTQEDVTRRVKALKDQLVRYLETMGEGNYREKRQSAETYFLREVAGRFPMLEVGSGPADLRLHITDALERLVKFFPMKQCLLLRSDIQYLDRHTVYASWPRRRAPQKDSDLLDLRFEQKYRERLALTRIDKPTRGRPAIGVPSDLDLSWERSVWMASLPLGTGGDALLILVDPSGRPGQHADELGPLDRRLLREFAVTLRTELLASIAIQNHLTRVGHTLETPTQAMVADAAEVIEDSASGEQVKQLARNVMRRSRQLNYLAASLRWGLTRHRRTRVRPRTCNIGRLLRDVWEVFEAEARGYGCTLLRPETKQGQFPDIETWPDELEIAFYALIDNAVKYSFWKKTNPSRYEIRIWGHPLPRDERGILWYRVNISNLGIGIQPHEIKDGLIFRDGYRGIWASDRNRSGSGIGCPVAKEIIEQRHRGRLTIESRLPARRSSTSPTAEEMESAMRGETEREDALPPHINTAKVDLPYHQEPVQEDRR